MKNRSPRITLYTTPGCSHCRQLKHWLQQHHVPFREMDVQRSSRALREFQRHGGRGVPLLLVGETRITGFEPKRLAGHLRKAGVELGNAAG